MQRKFFSHFSVEFFQVITRFYDMLPQTTGEADKGNSHLASFSTDSSAAHMADLTTALRISISGENMELNPDLPMTRVDTVLEQTLFFPNDMPVDLRVKLAVAMIHTGKEVPEVKTTNKQTKGEGELSGMYSNDVLVSMHRNCWSLYFQVLRTSVIFF